MKCGIAKLRLGYCTLEFEGSKQCDIHARYMSIVLWKLRSENQDTWRDHGQVKKHGACCTNEEATEGEQENYLCNMELGMTNFRWGLTIDLAFLNLIKRIKIWLITSWIDEFKRRKLINESNHYIIKLKWESTLDWIAQWDLSTTVHVTYYGLGHNLICLGLWL